MAASSSISDEGSSIDPPTGHDFGTLHDLQNAKLISLSLEYIFDNGQWTGSLLLSPISSSCPAISKKTTGRVKSRVRDLLCRSTLVQLLGSEYADLHSERFKIIWDRRYNNEESRYGFARPPWKKEGSSQASLVVVPKHFWTYENLMPEQESRTVEYKACAWNPGSIRDVACKVMCSFLNTKGGSVYFGVNDDCRIVGIKADRKSLDMLLQLFNAYFQERFDPPLEPSMYTITFHQVYSPDNQIAVDTWVIQIEVSYRKYDVYFFKQTGSSSWDAWFRRDATVQAMLPSQFKKRLRKPLLIMKEAMSYH